MCDLVGEDRENELGLWRRSGREKTEVLKDKSRKMCKKKKKKSFLVKEIIAFFPAEVEVECEDKR